MTDDKNPNPGTLIPVITPQMIEEQIIGEGYITASAALAGEIVAYDDAYADTVDTALRRLTLCVLVLRNGTTIVSEHVWYDDSANPDDTHARRSARRAAVNRIFALELYRLRS